MSADLPSAEVVERLTATVLDPKGINLPRAEEFPGGTSWQLVALADALTAVTAERDALRETLSEIANCQSPEGPEFLLAFVKAKAREHLKAAARSTEDPEASEIALAVFEIDNFADEDD